MKRRRNGTIKDRENPKMVNDKERNLDHKWMKWGTMANPPLLRAWKEWSMCTYAGRWDDVVRILSVGASVFPDK